MNTATKALSVYVLTPGVSVVGVSDATEALLARRVPYLMTSSRHGCSSRRGHRVKAAQQRGEKANQEFKIVYTNIDGYTCIVMYLSVRCKLLVYCV